MPTTMTLDGVRARRAGAALKRAIANLRSNLGAAGDAPPPRDPFADQPPGATAEFTSAAFAWGILSFAASTVVVRALKAIGR